MSKSGPKLPKRLQSTLWSVDINDLDLKKNKWYIVNQVLAYGSISDWQWLFKTYPREAIISVFLKKPAKIYRPERFSFAKNILLGLKSRDLIKEYYVINTPRIIKH
ncbi:hypothetical protein HY946_02420 [Candidatus Gottesmanbacteria bacterium]|nr:hypothetical protein [Candidatus Gottesmanbacteria bacterium]